MSINMINVVFRIGVCAKHDSNTTKGEKCNP